MINQSTNIIEETRTMGEQLKIVYYTGNRKMAIAGLPKAMRAKRTTYVNLDEIEVLLQAGKQIEFVSYPDANVACAERVLRSILRLKAKRSSDAMNLQTLYQQVKGNA